VRRGMAREVTVVAVIAAASLAVRLAAALSMDVFQDEPLYWWQAYGSVSFCPHPPVVALMVRLGTAMLGRNVAGLRMGSLLAGTAAVVMAYVLARRIYGGRAGLWAAALFASCPLFVALGTVTGPDAPLLFLWLLFMYAAWRGTEARSLAWWVAAGVVLAAGLYSKYMMVLAVPSLGVALVASPRGRQALRSPGPWLAVLIGLALFVPVFLAWDARHGWPALGYHLVARHQWKLSAGLIADHVGTHLLALSPLLVVGVFWALGRWWPLRRRSDWRCSWVAAFGWVPIVFFALPSLFTERRMIRVQWDAVGYAAGIVAFALLLRERGVRGRRLRRRRWLGGAAVGLGATFLSIALVTVMWPSLAFLVGARPLTARMIGWRELADDVRRLQAAPEGRSRFLVTESFRTAFCLSFRLGVREGIYTLAHERNMRYGLEEELSRLGIDEAHMLAERTGQDALYVHEYHFSARRGADDPPWRIYRLFSRVEQVGDSPVTLAGRQLRHYGLFRCYDLESKPAVR